MPSTYQDLKGKAENVLFDKGLTGFVARVAAFLDVSGSTASLYKNGTMQATIERCLGLGYHFDDNHAIDVFTFGKGNYHLGELTEADYPNYVVRQNFVNNLESTTFYAGVMRRALDYYFPGSIKEKRSGGGLFSSAKTETIVEPAGMPAESPVYAFFFTDGNNYDEDETKLMLRLSSHLPIFWQFVGVGRETFSFLKSLDSLSGRLLDNANFFHVPDMAKEDDTKLYEKMMTEFPGWIPQARAKGMLR